MLRTIAFLAYECLYVGATVFMIPYYRWLCKKDKERAEAFVYRLVRRWAKRSLKTAGAEIEIAGMENLMSDDAPAVYVGNHQGMADIPLVLAGLGRPKGIIAKGELARYRLFAMWMRAFGCVFVDRQDARKAAKAMREASDNVGNGIPMIIFAEGTRSRDGEIGQFKPGAFKIAHKSKVPVVPFCVDNTGNMFEYNGKKLAKNNVVRLHILPPIDTGGYGREEWKALPDLCEDMIRNELCRMRKANGDKEP